MSSHHIVRENQEPALLVADFHALPPEQLGQLLEWSPLIVTDRANLDFFLAEGIKVDVVIGDVSDGITQEATRFVAPSEEGTMIEHGIAYLLGQGFSAVNILTDYLPESLAQYAGDINIVLYAEGRRYAYFQEKYEKWKPEGELVFINDTKVKSLVGLDDVRNGVFVTGSDGFVEVIFNTSDWVLVGEEI